MCVNNNLPRVALDSMAACPPNTIKSHKVEYGCCTAGFWHPFSVSPSLSVLSCPFECNKAIIICQIKSYSNWILLPLVGLPLILPSIISCKVRYVSKHGLSIDVSFSRVQYLPVFVYSPENFLISNFIKPADLFSFFSISTFQRLLIFFCLSESMSLCTSPLHVELHSRPSISLFSSLVPIHFTS